MTYLFPKVKQVTFLGGKCNNRCPIEGTLNHTCSVIPSPKLSGSRIGSFLRGRNESRVEKEAKSVNLSKPFHMENVKKFTPHQNSFLFVCLFVREFGRKISMCFIFFLKWRFILFFWYSFLNGANICQQTRFPLMIRRAQLWSGLTVPTGHTRGSCWSSGCWTS